MTRTQYEWPLRDPDAPATRFLRGAELARHVTAGLLTAASSEQIAQGAGYRVPRCGQRLAAAGFAPIARELLARSENEQRWAEDEDRVTAEWEAWKARQSAADHRAPKRPAPGHDELLDELTDLAACGLSFDQAAERMGITPGALRRRVSRARLAREVRRIFPDRFTRKSRTLAEDLIELAAAGESYAQATRRCGYEQMRSATKRLSESGDLQRVRAAFGHPSSMWAAA